jgi:hypothetical protein
MGAGSGEATDMDGTGILAKIQAPRGLAIDAANNLYVTTGGNKIRKITPAGIVTTLASTTAFSAPNGIIMDAAGILYVMDGVGTTATSIRKITTGNVVSTIAGGTSGNLDGVGEAAQFSTTASGLYLDTNSNLYVGDTGNNSIRIVHLNTPPSDTLYISGILACGATLTANTINIVDADGLGAFNYVWWQSTDVNGTYTLAGSSKSTLVLTSDHVGNYIRVVASYTDGGGVAESTLYATITQVEFLSIPAPTNISASSPGKNTAIVKWDAAIDATSTTQYVVTILPIRTQVVVLNNATQVTLTGISARIYTFTVRSEDSGIASATSAESNSVRVEEDTTNFSFMSINDSRLTITILSAFRFM